jgi:hypothetical protein
MFEHEIMKKPGEDAFSVSVLGERDWWVSRPGYDASCSGNCTESNPCRLNQNHSLYQRAMPAHIYVSEQWNISLVD